MVVERLIYFVISGALLMFIGVTWFSVKRWIGKIDVKFDRLIDEVAKISREDVKHSERISNLQASVKVHESRINNHSHRIRELETEQASCRNNTNNK